MDPPSAERLTELCDLLKKVEDEHNQMVDQLSVVDKLKTNNNSSSNGGGEQVQGKQKATKVRSLYKNAIQSHESESKVLREALDVVVDIRQALRQRQRKFIADMNSGNQSSGGVRRGALMKMFHQSASALPLFIPGRLGEPAPPLCGCIPADPSYVAKEDDMVAAFVPSPDGDGSKVWVLGEVVKYQSGTYEIDDIDEEQKERHSIGRRRVIPLPTMRANPLTNPEALFPKDALVLALYPQTTCFYRAIIDRPPEDPTQDYMVSFEDATYTEGYSPPLAVPQRYVITSREPKK